LMDNRRWGAWSVAFDPAGAVLAIGTDNGGVLVWDIAAAQLRKRLETTAAVRSLAFSDDGRLLAAAEGSRVQIWDMNTLTNVAALKGHEKQVWSVVFAPSSSVLHGAILSGSQDGTIRVWDLGSARERAALNWSMGVVRALAIAPDGMTAVAGGENGSIVMWDC